MKKYSVLIGTDDGVFSRSLIEASAIEPRPVLCLWQVAGYYDESDDVERGYSVAGFLGHQHDCVHLELAWQERILNKYGLNISKHRN